MWRSSADADPGDVSMDDWAQLVKSELDKKIRNTE